MDLLGKLIIGLGKVVPLRIRLALVGSSHHNPSRFAVCLNRIFNSLSRERFPVVTLGGSLAGYRMRVDCHRFRSFVYGTYEPPVLQTIIKVVQAGWTAIDAGAYIGYYTLLLAKQVGPSGRVIAFEPLPENFRVLSENIELNRLQNVIAENKAVTDQSGVATLYRGYEGPFSLTSSIVAASGEGIEVQAVSLDEYLNNYRERVAFVKIDVEGAESQVLDGMKRILKEDRPIVVVEVMNFDRYDDKHPALQLLRNFGYTFCILSKFGIIANVLASPSSKG